MLRSNKKKILDVMLVYICLVETIILFEEMVLNTYLIDFKIVACISTISSLLVLFNLKNYRKFGINMMLMFYTIISHFGYVFSVSLYGDLANTRVAYSSGIGNTEYFRTAVYLSAFAINIFTLATAFYTNRKKNNIDKLQGINSTNIVSESFIFYSQCCVLILETFLSGAMYILFGNMLYSERSELTGGFFTLFSYMSYFAENALPLIIALCRKRRIKMILPVYIILCIFQLLLGNRGEIMYGLVICIAIYVIRYKKINIKYMVLFGVSAVVILPIIAVVREGGSFNGITVNGQISSFLSELGFQIVPTSYTARFIQLGGKFQYGATYVYSFILRIANIFGGASSSMKNSLALVDNMLPNVGYGLGFSQIAEAYYNFGIIGILIEFILLAKISIFFEDKIDVSNKQGIIIYVCLAVNLINITRNKFDSTIIFLVYGIIMYLLNNFIVSNTKTKI